MKPKKPFTFNLIVVYFLIILGIYFLFLGIIERNESVCLGILFIGVGCLCLKLIKEKSVELDIYEELDDESKPLVASSCDKVKNDFQEVVETVKYNANYYNYQLPSLSLVKEIESELFLEGVRKSKDVYSMFLGKTEDDNYLNIDFRKWPNLLICGVMLTGKTSLMNSIICNILLRFRPEEVKLILIDPKQVELISYNGVPHLLCPVVTDLKKILLVLQKVVIEMEKRYQFLASQGFKTIQDYNESLELNDSLTMKMNYCVLFIDEFPSLISYAKKEVEEYVEHITKFGYNVGIHCVLSTSNVSNQVLPPILKSQFLTKVVLQLSSKAAFKIILDNSDIDAIDEFGYAFYKTRFTQQFIKMPYIHDKDIKRIVTYVCKQQAASYDESLTNTNIEGSSPVGHGGENDDSDDPIYDEVVKFAVDTGKVSASLLQRRFCLGYNRAARIIDLLEERGIIGPQNGSKPREVLVKLKSENTEE